MFDAVRIRLLEIGEAVQALPSHLLDSDLEELEAAVSRLIDLVHGEA